MRLKDTLASVRPRETAGPRSADRFDYQRDWALCQLLQLHESGQPYLMVFDYHDDVLVLDSEDDPTKIAFFQVKTKGASAWTVTDILRVVKKKTDGTGLSFVAKLYANKVSFPLHTDRLTFVSNTYVNCTLTNGSSPVDQLEIAFQDISEAERKRITDAVRKQCKLSEDPSLAGLLVLHAAPISLKDHVGHAKGKITEFLERIVPGKKIRPGAIYSGLAGEIVRKNHCTENCSSLEEIAQKKGLSRSEVDSLLAEMRIYEDEQALWPQIENRLNAEQLSFSKLSELRKRWPIVVAKHTDPANTLLRAAFREIRQMVDASQPGDRLVEWLDGIVANAPKDSAWRQVFDEDDIRIIALITIYDDSQPKPPKLSPPGPGIEDAKA